MPEPTLEPHGKGFLVIDGRIESNRMKEVPLGTCPRCETKATPWEPPTDARYLQHIASLKEGHRLATDADAHMFHVKRQGCVIHVCQCGTSYAIPASAVEIKS